MARRAEGQQISPVYFVLLGVVLLAAIFMLLRTFLFGGEPEPEAAPTPVIPRAATPSPTPEVTEVFEIFEGRDPFRPLIDPNAATPGPGESPTPAPTAGPGETPGPTTVPTPRPPRQGVQVEVLSVASDSSSATVRVGSRIHENARPGQTLSDGIVLESIQGDCVTFRRNSERPFTLCEGELILK